MSLTQKSGKLAVFIQALDIRLLNLPVNLDNMHGLIKSPSVDRRCLSACDTHRQAAGKSLGLGQRGLTLTRRVKRRIDFLLGYQY